MENPQAVSPEDIEPGRVDSPDRLLHVAQMLWERRRLILRAIIVGGVIGGLISIVIPKRYTSTSRLMPPENQSTSGLALLTTMAASTSAALGAADLLGVKSNGALFVGVLHSRTVQDRLIERFDLRRIYRDSTMQVAREDLESHTSISEDRKSGIISISVTEKDRQRARDLAAAYIQELDRCVADLSTSAARRERLFLEQRLQAVKQDLDAAQKDFSEFSSKNSTIDIKEQGKAMVEAAATLQGHLIAAQSELSSLEQIYTESNVRVRTARARVAELQRQLNKLGGGDLQAKNPVKEDANATANEQLYPSIRKLPLLGVTYADLYRRVKVQDIVYETLTKQYELAKVQEAKETPSVRVLDPANWPEKKSFPPRAIIVLSACTMALIYITLRLLFEDALAQLDMDDPRKQFATELIESARATVARVPLLGRVTAASRRVADRVRKRSVASSATAGR